MTSNESSVAGMDRDNRRMVPPSFHLAPSDLAMNTRLQPVKQRSDVGTYSGGQKINITLPPVSYMGEDATLSFDAQVTASSTPVTYDQFPSSIQGIFDRVRVYLGSTLVEDIEDYNLLDGLIYLTEDARVNGTTNVVPMIGNGSDTNRGAYSLALHRYNVRLHCESLQQFLPLDKLGKALRIEIQLAQPANCLESDSLSPDCTYSLSNVYFNFNRAILEPDFERMLMASINKGTYQILYHSWSHYGGLPVTGTAFQQEVPARFRTINRFLSVIRTQADLGTYKLGIFRDFPAFPASTVSLLINSTRYPEDEYSNLGTDVQKSELFRAFIDTLNQYKKGIKEQPYAILGALNWINGGTSHAFYCQDIREDKRDNAIVWSNGVDTQKAGSSVIYRHTLTGAYASSGTFDSFTQFEAGIFIRNGGDRIDVQF